MTQYNLVISNGVLKNGSDVFNILDDDTGGAGTFSVKLNATGLEADPVTHWACRTPLQADVYNALTNMTTTQFKAFVDAKAAEKGRTPVGSITAFKNDLKINAGDFWAFIGSLGLKIVQPSMDAMKK